MTDDPRTHILDAAEVCFAEKGLAGTRVARIAESAGVNKAMLYYYFGSKEGLYRAVIGRVAERVAGLVRVSLASREGDLLARLEAFMDGYHRVLVEHPNFARIMAREILDGARYAGPLFRELIGPLTQEVGTTVHEAQRAGEINPEVGFPLAVPVVISPFVFFALARPVLEQVFDPLDDAFTEAYHHTAKEIILNGLRAGREDA